MVKPLSPTDIVAHKEKVFPYQVIDAVNNLLAAKFVDKYSVVHLNQDDVITEILRLFGEDTYNGLTVERSTIFANGWLNFEEIFRKAGWEVKYDKPAYNEFYSPFFTFEAK